MKIVRFTDLDSWKEAHKLVLMIYMITDDFPKKEIFSLVNQMRRCAVSVSSNIAEGFSRRTNKEKVQFNYVAKGSVTELQNQLMIARDVKYLTQQGFNSVFDQSERVIRLVSGSIRSLKRIS